MLFEVQTGELRDGWYSVNLRVFDSHLDQFKVVNNSVYSRYLEVTRARVFECEGRAGMLSYRHP